MRFERTRQRLQQRRDDAGFSMIEMAVTVMVFSIVMVVVFGTVLNVLSASTTFKERTQEQADTRLAIDTLVRDLRQAYTGKVAPMNSIVTMQAGTISFYSPDQVPDFHLRLITYKLTAGSLTRSVTTSTNVASAVVGTANAWAFPGVLGNAVAVLTGVTNSTLFTYKDQLNGTPATVDLVQAVQLDFVIDNSPNTSPTPQTYHTQVDLRVTDT
jgi:prepilin-type N-terminal cleavage/methylation domain-containing protein